MRVRVENVCDGERFPHPVVLLRGVRAGWTAGAAEADTGSLSVRMTSLGADKENQETRPVRIARDGRFKCLLHLWPGDNRVEFINNNSSNNSSSSSNVNGVVIDKLNLRFEVQDEEEDESSPQIRLLYLVCQDADGIFQGPSDEDCSAASACERISVGAALIQAFVGQSLSDHGFGGRRSLRFRGWRRAPDGRLLPRCRVERVDGLTESAARATREGDELWRRHARHLLMRYGPTRDKFLAVMAATRYSNPTGAIPATHAETLSLTRAHAPLGGGGLALVGSGCLRTWPRSLAQVQGRFADRTPTDRGRFMDDSANRHTVGGCFATSLGSALHELGHALGLAHDRGVMARGFDDLGVFFADVQPIAEGALTTDKPRHEGLGKDHLQDYHRRQRLTKLQVWCGGAVWTESAARILNSHKCVRPGNPDAGAEMSYDQASGVVKSSSLLAAAELRKKGDVVEDVYLGKGRLRGGGHEEESRLDSVVEFSVVEALEKHSTESVDEVFLANEGGGQISIRL